LSFLEKNILVLMTHLILETHFIALGIRLLVLIDMNDFYNILFNNQYFKQYKSNKKKSLLNK